MKLKEKVPGYTEPEMPFKSNKLIRDFNELYAKIYDKEKLIQVWSFQHHLNPDQRNCQIIFKGM